MTTTERLEREIGDLHERSHVGEQLPQHTFYIVDKGDGYYWYACTCRHNQQHTLSAQSKAVWFANEHMRMAHRQKKTERFYTIQCIDNKWRYWCNMCNYTSEYIYDTDTTAKLVGDQHMETNHKDVPATVLQLAKGTDQYTLVREALEAQIRVLTSQLYDTAHGGELDDEWLNALRALNATVDLHKELTE